MVRVERGVRFRLPGEGWRPEASGPQQPNILLRLHPPADADPGDGAMIHFSAFDLGEGIPPRVICHARLEQHRATLDPMDLLHDDGTTVGGAVGHRTDLRGVPKGAPAMKVTELVWSKDGTGCLLNLIATEELHAAWLPHLEAVAATLEHLDG